MIPATWSVCVVASEWPAPAISASSMCGRSWCSTLPDLGEPGAAVAAADVQDGARDQSGILVIEFPPQERWKVRVEECRDVALHRGCCTWVVSLNVDPPVKADHSRHELVQC